MSTYDNVLGNFTVSNDDDLSDLDNENYEDSASEPEPEMGIYNTSSQSNAFGLYNQNNESLESKSNK